MARLKRLHASILAELSHERPLTLREIALRVGRSSQVLHHLEVSMDRLVRMGLASIVWNGRSFRLTFPSDDRPDEIWCAPVHGDQHCVPHWIPGPARRGVPMDSPQGRENSRRWVERRDFEEARQAKADRLLGLACRRRG